MNVAVETFRQELRHLPGRHPLFQGIHPFWRDCFRGRLANEDVCRWGLDIYPVIRDFSRLYVHVAAKCEVEATLTFLAETIFEETGSGVAAESHPLLFRNFLNSLGVADGQISGASATSAGQEFWNFAWRTAREGSFLEGLALVGLGIERPLPALFQMTARAFQRHHGLAGDAVKFFALHTIADVKHSQVAARIVAELARTPAQQDAVKRILNELWSIQARQLDELYAQAVKGRASAGLSQPPRPRESNRSPAE